MSAVQASPNNPPAPAPASWRSDLLRAAAIFAAAAVLGFSTNALRQKPVPVASSTGPGAMPEKAERVTVAELQQWRLAGSMVLLDVRKEESFRKARPLDAINLPANDFTRYYGALAPRLAAAERIVIMCESENCPLSDRVAARLKVLEHKHVYVLEGGWQKYLEANLPYVQGVEE
jgi:3-mercaptopyruvate sulfurtransferase SseA